MKLPMLARLAMLSVVVAMSMPVAAEVPQPVKIGVVLPLTGPTAVFGKDGRMGADLAAEQINAAGGVLGGRKIALVFDDEKGNAQDGVAAVQKLMSQGVKAIIAGMNSSIALAETSVTKNRILHINPAAQADAITNQGSPWLFQINNTATTNSDIFNDYLLNTVKPKTIAYMGENSEFNKAILENLKKALEKSDTKLVEVATFDSGVTDFTSIITRLKAASPEMIYVVDAFPARSAQIWKQIRQQGGFKLEAHSPGSVQQSSIVPAEGAMEGVITSDIFMAAGATGAAADFVKAYKDKYQADPSKVSLVVYEAVKVVAEAMTKADTDSDYSLLSKTIRDNVWQTPRGKLTFDEKRRAKAPFFYIQVVKGNDLTLRETFAVK